MDVPCYKQEKNYTCAVCCLRMVLKYYGKQYDESYLERACGTTDKGTSAQNLVDAAKKLGFWAVVCEGDLEFIHVCISNETPVIVYLRTKYLSWWKYDAIHAVVVTEIDENYVYINEPWFGEKVRCEHEDFVAAWDELFNLMILIKPKVQHSRS